MVATLPVAAPSSARVLPALPARSSSDCDELGLPPCPDCSKAEKPAISRARRTTLAATSTSSMTGAEALCSRGITVFCALASATAFATSSELQLIASRSACLASRACLFLLPNWPAPRPNQPAPPPSRPAPPPGRPSPLPGWPAPPPEWPAPPPWWPPCPLRLPARRESCPPCRPDPAAIAMSSACHRARTAPKLKSPRSAARAAPPWQQPARRA
mmetsp:Transcript_51342/g.136035  ORF Transcript_51342/g.136035 Transcript_51342/m.136035 type:complete len:215 (+) Transcript_51342:130-774(+)